MGLLSRSAYIYIFVYLYICLRLRRKCKNTRLLDSTQPSTIIKYIHAAIKATKLGYANARLSILCSFYTCYT